MKNILKKALEELSKDKPRIDYVMGMLEVLIENDVASSYVPPYTSTPNLVPTITKDFPIEIPPVTGEVQFRSRK